MASLSSAPAQAWENHTRKTLNQLLVEMDGFEVRDRRGGQAARQRDTRLEGASPHVPLVWIQPAGAQRP
jgi:hypothetical protein